jgi:hypothetical protein
MSRYSKEKREHALSLMAPPNNLPPEVRHFGAKNSDFSLISEV